MENRSDFLDRRDFLAAGGKTLAGVGTVATAASSAGGPATPGGPLIVDCQSHIYCPEIVALMERRKTEPYVERRGGQRHIIMGDWVRKFRPHHTSIAGKLAAMDANGIRTTMLSINDPGPEWFGKDGPAVAQIANDFIAAFGRKYPGRFHGLIVLPLQDRQASERELDRCVKKLGMKGILLYTNLAGRWPDEPRFRWLFARATELKIPILLHPAKPTTIRQVRGYNLISLMGNMFDDTIALARIIACGLLDQFPALQLVCPHLGGTLPYIAGRFDHQVTVLKRSNQHLQRKPSEYLRHVYLDIVSPLDLAIRFAYDLVGAERLLFSSDHPWVDPAIILDQLRRLKLPPDQEAMILGGNARRLFRLVS